MREIKFRAWDKSIGHMFNAHEISHWPLGRVLKGDHNFIFMQYTGLKDKNGKEIFEGDIVKSTVKTKWTDFPIYTVEWRQELCRYILVQPDGMNGFHGLEESYTDEDVAKDPPENQYIEVIGNIYEAPDLLNSGEVNANAKPKRKQAHTNQIGINNVKEGS